MKVRIFIILTLFLISIETTTVHTAVTFQRFTVASGIHTPHGDWAGDIDGTSPSRCLDIFATINSPAQAIWYANSNDGRTWSAKNEIWTTPRNLYNYEIAGADFDDDGNMDAISVDLSLSDTSYLGISENLGGGVFTTKIIDTVEGRFRQMRAMDLDADNDIDIIITVNTSSSQPDIGAYWYENTGGLNFTRHFIGKCNPWKVDCFDDDGDGHLEVVVSEVWHGADSSAAPCQLILYKNDGTEIFTQFVLDTYTTKSAGVRCADLNSDGKTDIVCGDIISGMMYWYENMGSNSFTKHIIDNACPDVDGIDVGDFEPDGDMDIVAAGRSYWFRWYENDGTGTFTPHVIDNQYEKFDLPYVTYLDGDTCPDIILTETSSDGHIFAYLNSCADLNTEETSSIPTNKYLKTPSLINSNLVTLEYGIEKTTNMKIELIDITGRTVKVIENSNRKKAGAYKTNWKLNEEPNGIYFLRLDTKDNFHIVKKITIIR